MKTNKEEYDELMQRIKEAKEYARAQGCEYTDDRSVFVISLDKEKEKVR